MVTLAISKVSSALCVLINTSLSNPNFNLLLGSPSWSLSSPKPGSKQSGKSSVCKVLGCREWLFRKNSLHWSFSALRGSVVFLVMCCKKAISPEHWTCCAYRQVQTTKYQSPCRNRKTVKSIVRTSSEFTFWMDGFLWCCADANAKRGLLIPAWTQPRAKFSRYSFLCLHRTLRRLATLFCGKLKDPLPKPHPPANQFYTNKFEHIRRIRALTEGFVHLGIEGWSKAVDVRGALQHIWLRSQAQF